jgi:hypothetical protein
VHVCVQSVHVCVQSVHVCVQSVHVCGQEHPPGTETSGHLGICWGVHYRADAAMGFPPEPGSVFTTDARGPMRAKLARQVESSPEIRLAGRTRGGLSLSTMAARFYFSGSLRESV